METFSTRSIPGSSSSSLWAWSKGQHAQPLLAVSSGANTVAVLTAQGTPWPYAKGGIKNIRGTPAVCLAWHPEKQLLAVAWQDGAVSLWDAPKCHLEEDSKTHRQQISQLIWHPDEKHFMTADNQGKVAIWEVNSHWQPSAVSSCCEDGGNITHAVWLTGSCSHSTPAAALCYAVSTPGGATVTLKCLDSTGVVSVVQDIGEGLVGLLHYQERGQLVAVTSTGSAVILTNSSPDKTAAAGAGADGWTVLLRLKITNAAAGAGLQVCWAGPHTLALAGSQDTAVRMLQLDTDDNYVLDLKNTAFLGGAASRPSSAAGDSAGIVALVYEPGQQVLAAATAAGRVCLFKHWLSRAHAAAAAAAAAADPASQWEPSHSFWVGGAPEKLSWGPTAQIMAAGCADGLYLCVKSPLYHKLSDGYAAVQVAAGRVLVQRLDGSGPAGSVSTSLQLASIDVTAGALLLHDGWHAEILQLNSLDGSTTMAAQFEVPGLPLPDKAAAGSGAEADAERVGALGVTVGPGDGRVSMALHGDCVYRTAEGRVEVCSWAGVVKQSLPFDESQGQPALLDIHNGYLAVLTSKALVRVFKLAGTEVKPHAGPGPIVSPSSRGSVQLDSLRVNCDGSMVCALGSLPGSGGCQDPRLFVYSAGRNEPLVMDLSGDMTAPRAMAWDLSDPRLLAVQTGPLVRSQAGSRPVSGDGAAGMAASGTLPGRAGSAAAAAAARGGGAGGRDSSDGNELMARSSDVATVFATEEAGLLLQEYQDLDPVSSGCVGFLGVSAPHLLLLKGSAAGQQLHGGAVDRSRSSSSNGSSGSLFAAVPLRCFSGLADADDATRRALLDFNYLLAVGRLDEAFRVVSSLKSPAVWRNMAHMAIKNKQLAVAEHCLGNMQHIRGAKALRESAGMPELDARVGLVAVQLGLPEDAARLFSSCERWDLVEQLHAASGGWQEALQVATKHDRARLQALHHAYARHCEAVGDLKSAMQHYIASGTAATEVPRLLWRADDLAALERQVLGSEDAGLLTWWARACEANNNFAQAISCYQKAGNQLAVLRIHCATGDWEAAEQVVASTQDPAAAFHLARLYEAQDRVQDALRCFSISKRYSHGARLAKRCQMDQELLSLALKSPPSTMLDAADHLLAAGNMQAAAMLYQKGGKLGKAVEMAFAAGMMDVLDSIAGQLDQDADAELIARCAEAFVAAGRHDAAVRLLVKGKQVERALDLLLGNEVPLTEELAEALTPAKTAENADQRNAVLLRLAQAAKAQGLYHLACKKYTQAGDRLRAMRALIKSGDVEKIVFFAGVSRQREVYIMAANWLQTLNWRAQPEYLNHILSFYTKAGAADSLAQFYLGCAQTELNQFKAYDKALQAMQEAAKHLAKSRTADTAQLAALQEASDRISRFVQAHSLIEQDPAAAVSLCQQLLQEAPEQVGPMMPDVAVGDVYALLVQWCMGQGNTAQALQLVEQMMDRHVPPGQYLDPDVLAAVQQAMGSTGVAIQQLGYEAQGQHGAPQQGHVEEDLPYIQDEAGAAVMTSG